MSADQINRLRKAAQDAIKDYGDETAHGGEPPFPQWAQDWLDVLDRQGRGEPVLSPKNAGVLLAGLHRFSIQEERIAARELIAALSAPQPAEPAPNGYNTPYNLGWAAGWDAHKRANPPEAQPAEPVKEVGDEDLWSLSRDCKVGGGWSQWSIDPVKFGRLLLTRYGSKS